MRDVSRPGAIAKRSSSSSPMSGDFNTAAKVRSSSGKSAARPAAIKSITAIWSVNLSRSAPATGMFFCLRARMTASKKGPRLRTKIKMSPAATGRKRPSRNRRHVRSTKARQDRRSSAPRARQAGLPDRSHRENRAADANRAGLLALPASSAARFRQGRADRVSAPHGPSRCRRRRGLFDAPQNRKLRLPS